MRRIATLATLAIVLLAVGPLPAKADPITVSGHIEDGRGRPIISCSAGLVRPDGESVGLDDRTDADGYFEIPDVPAGAYKVYANCGGGLETGAFIEQFYGGGVGFESGETITAADDDLTFDFVIERYGRIRGNATSADGSILGNGFWFDLYETDTGEYIRTQTLSYNLMDFDAVEPGSYAILFYSKSGIVAEAWHFPQWYGGAPLYRPDLAAVITVGDGEVVSDIDIFAERLYQDIFESVFVDDIAWAQFAGITKGCANGAFCPTEPVTRGQMAAFLSRALGFTDQGTVDFVDDDDSVFQADIERLATAGVTLGCNPPANDRFCPDDLVTRGQMAAFLVRALGYTDQGGVDFEDDNGSVFEADIERLATAGVTSGCSADRFCPNDPVTREQMTAFLHRALGGVLYPEQASGASPRS